MTGHAVTRTRARLLGNADLPEVWALLDASPVHNAWVASRIAARGLMPRKLLASVWGYPASGPLDGLCYSGSTIVPAGLGHDGVAIVAERILSAPRACSSIVGSADQVLALWARLEPQWGRAREVRSTQPLLVMTSPSPVPVDPRVRRAVAADLESLIPACIAMYTEEVGVSPIGLDGGRQYGERIADLVRSGRSYVSTDADGVVFKAEIGAVTPNVCQLQGVWVRPDRRGHGLGATGVAAVVADVLATVAPTVSLYVNDYNVAAVRTYRRCGFEQTGTFASVLF